MHIRRWVCVYASAGCVYAAGAYTHRRVRIRGSVRIRERWVLVRSGCVYTPGCVYAGRCVYASGRCVYAAGAYTHQGAYTRMGAFTRVVGVYTQRVHICTRVCIRGSVRIRERWVCIHRGCVYAPPRVYTGFCVYAPPTAFTQESTNRNDITSYRCTVPTATLRRDTVGLGVEYMHTCNRLGIFCPCCTTTATTSSSSRTLPLSRRGPAQDELQSWDDRMARLYGGKVLSIRLDCRCTRLCLRFDRRHRMVAIRCYPKSRSSSESDSRRRRRRRRIRP